MVAVSQIFDGVKSVALWSANIRKLDRDHKGYSSAAIILYEKHDEDFILLTRKLNKAYRHTKSFFIRHFHFFAFCPCKLCMWLWHTCEPSGGSIFLPILRVPSVPPVNFQNLPPMKKIKYKKILTYILRSIFLEIPHLELPRWRKTPRDTNGKGECHI